MNKLLYPSIRVRSMPARVMTRVSVSFTFLRFEINFSIGIYWSRCAFFWISVAGLVWVWHCGLYTRLDVHSVTLSSIYTSPGSVSNTTTNTEVFQNTNTNTKVGIPNTEYRRKNTKKTINWYFNFVNTTHSWSEFTPVLAANSARLNHFHDPSIQ